MKPLLSGLLIWLLCSVSEAATINLAWDYDTSGGGTIPAAADVLARSVGGTFSPVATVPSLPSTFSTVQADGTSMEYQIRNVGGVSNILLVQLPAAPPSGPTVEERLTAVEQRNAIQDTAISNLNNALLATEAKIGPLQTALTALEDRVTALETAPPPPSGANLKITIVSNDAVEILGTNCTSLKTTGTGLKRTVTCLH